MNSKSINLSKEFDFFFTFPFNLGFSIEHISSPFYLLSLERVATLLNINFPKYSWSMEQFDENLPLSLKNKGGVIAGKPKVETATNRIIQASFEREQVGARFVELIEESVVYFDHGVGSVNLTIRADLESIEAISKLQQLAMGIISDIRKKEESLYVFYEWEAFREAMQESFESAGVLYDMWGILGTGGKGRGPSSYVGENAILRTEESAPLKIFVKDIAALLAPFTGLKPEINLNLVPHVDGIIYLAEGWDGQIAIVSDPIREKWLKNLWQFATDYGTILHDLDRYLYARTLTLRKESRSITLAQSRKEMDAIHRIELAIDVITHEILPHNFGGIVEEIQVYRGIYDSWEMKTIVESLKNKFTFLNTMFTNISAGVSNAIQVRMNNTILVFTILTFAGVLSSVISTTDFNGIFLSPEVRLFLIVFGTVSAGLLSIISLVIRRGKPNFGK